MRTALLIPLVLLPLGAQTTKVLTPEDLFRRNVGTQEQQYAQFPPHKIVGNLYYVGTGALASFLLSTPDGLILINSDYEGVVPVIRKSVEQLGFQFTDIKILLGSHAHADHMEGDALVKELTGARVMAMAEDLPALESIRPGGKPHPIDSILHDGETVTLGGTTLLAHLTPGHTRGCTSWEIKIPEGGRTYDVVIIGSIGVNPGYKLVNNPDIPQIADEYRRSFKLLRSIACDIPLGSHPAMYRMAEKYPKLGKGPNPFIDPEGYKTEIDTNEAVFNLRYNEQKKAAGE
jgi:metallo-beta-lactamase class B